MGPPLVKHDHSVRDALLEMQEGDVGVAVVVADDGTVLGTVTDGDVRRGALAGADLSGPVVAVMGEPVTVAPDAADAEVRGLLEARHVGAAAVIGDGRLVGMRTLAEVGGRAPAAGTTAVILAGGRGLRLRPLTEKVPKPLLMVGRSTILERLLEGLRAAGIQEVSLAVNYKAEAFEERLGDGSEHGVHLRYLRERKQLDTAGPLSLLPGPTSGPVLVANADQVTALHFARMIDFHRQEGAAITVGAFTHEVAIPYGVLRLDGRLVTGIVEKPTHHHLCNAGIYVLEPDVVPLVPRNTFFGMPALIEAVLARGRSVTAFPIVETFIDIGTPEELDKALRWFATGEEVQ